MLESKNSNLELKIKVLEAEKKFEKAKKDKEYWENCFFSVIITLLSFLMTAGFFFFKKPEYWLYPFLFFISLSILMILLVVVSYNVYKKKKKQLQKLEQELKRLEKEKGQN